MNKLIIAKSGFNAKTEINPDNLKFSSDYNTLKYYLSGHVVMNWTQGAPSNEVIVPHNLGYIPFYIAYIQQLGGTLYNLVPFSNARPLSNIIDYADVYADAANLYFVYHYEHFADHNTGTLDFYYKIFKNNLGF